MWYYIFRSNCVLKPISISFLYMAPNSLLSCNSFYLGLNLPAPPHSSSIISRRTLFIRPISFRAKQNLDQTPLILTVEMQSSTNKLSTTEPIAQEDTKKISSGGNRLASTENTGLNFGQLSSLVNIPTWAKFVLGSVIPLAIPLLRKSFRIKDVTKVVEEVAEAAEKAAEVTEKVAEEIAEALPDGKIKEAAIKLEKIALLVDKQAEVTETFIDKVDDAVEVLDTNLKLIAEMEIKKNDEEENTTSKKINVIEQSKEARQ